MTYLLPMIAVVLAVMVLSESITAVMCGGVALVLIGTALTRGKTSQDLS